MKFSIFVLRTLIFVAPFLGTVADTWTFDGALQAGDPTFIQPFSGYFVYYKVHTFTPITAGVYCIGNVAPTSISDTSLILYELSFDPSNILRNRVPYDNNSGPDQWAKITAYLTAGLPYKIVQTTYFGRQTGLYTLQIADQASCQASARPTSTPVPKCYRTSGSDITYSAIGTRGYVNYQRCSWLIEATGAAPFIHITFTSFDTELGYDSVNIYGGSNDSAPRLARLSGFYGSAVAYYLASPIFVTFSSDGSTTRDGFQATLEATNEEPRAPAPGQPSGSEPSGSSSGSSSTSSGELSSAAGFGIVIMISLLIFIINFVIGATIAFRLSRRGSSKKVSGATPTLKSTKATPASEQPTKSQGEPISLPTQSVVSSISISSSAQSALEDIVIRL